MNGLEKIPYHRHNGVDSPKVDIRLTDIITPESAPTSPTGGTVIDVEARDKIDSIISKLTSIGIFL